MGLWWVGMTIAGELVYELKSFSDPTVSPDGKRVIYAQSWVEGTGAAAENRSRLMLASHSQDSPREFTQGVADGGPRFSPDGEHLGFLRAAKAGEPRQVWVIHAHGGEARQITNSAKGVQDFAWSPDGLRMVFCADTEPAAGAAAGARVEGPRVVEVDRIRFRHDLQGWRGDAHYHLFIADLPSEEITQLTRGDWDDYGPVWSPDGTQIAFISGRREDRDFRALTEAYVVNVEGGVAECWSGALQSVGAVAWSPDSRRLAVIGSDDPAGMVLWQGWLYVVDDSRQPRRITGDEQRPTLGGGPGAARQPEIRWTDDGHIVFLGERHGESFVYQASSQGGKVQQLWGGGRLVSGLSLDAKVKRAALVSSSPSIPAELGLADLTEGVSLLRVDPNTDYLSIHPVPSLEKFSIEREGFEIEGRLWFPPFFDPSGSYPLVLDVHGGPNGAFYDSYVPWQQVLAGSGYLVLAVNPRGSSTYGNAFMRAVLDDWGGEDYLDLLAALDHVCQREYVDEDRLGIHGYSYGGLHDRVGHRPHAAVRRGGDRGALHQPLHHVWHLGHRGQLRGVAVGRLGDGRS